MNLRQKFETITCIQIPIEPLPVEKTIADALKNTLCKNALIRQGYSDAAFALKIGTNENADFFSGIRKSAPKNEPWCFIRIRSDGKGEIAASNPALLYAHIMRLKDNIDKLAPDTYETGKYHTAAFKWHRPLFDNLLTQVWRESNQFDAEQHIREMALSGYTHLEVNGMGAPAPFEKAEPGEFYAPFYSYALALDQYVYSSLNKGIYPKDYLAANLSELRLNAQLGAKYGLQPGLLCFEPRSVPEQLLQRYPTLRGARVDHPFRSRRPRYTLSVAHPLVREHYCEMIQKLLTAIPQLSYLSIWSNDSGAGFEYTGSLYVGRNGGPYLIREWRDPRQIAEAAGKNITGFMKLLRDAAREINPAFRVSLRIEPFKDEHDVILQNLEEGLDIEAPSLLVRGYDLPYRHPEYEDNPGVAATVHHTSFAADEGKILAEFRQHAAEPHLVYNQGNGFNFEPLLGVPFPTLLYQKLSALANTGFTHVANLGGAVPSAMAPFHINREVFREFMLNREMKIDSFLKDKAIEWATKRNSDALLKIWQLTEKAIHSLPTLPLYSSFGFVWLRLWVRPIIPDLLSIPKKDRRYYEKFMVSPDNNTNLADLGRDVLFQLITQESGVKFVQRVDDHVLSNLDKAIRTAENAAQNDPAGCVFRDHRDRLTAFRCWIKTLRAVAGWCAGVYGYLNNNGGAARENWLNYLSGIIADEIQNIERLLKLWQESNVRFMVVAKEKETPFLYGPNFGDLLSKKIALMEKYKNTAPRIDETIMWQI